MLDNDIKLAIKTLNTDSEKNLVYPFTNEDIKGYLDNFDFEGKDVLSVLASSDQVFDIFLRGANKIDTFDINPLTKYYFYLKKAGIKTLTRREFLKFFNMYVTKPYVRKGINYLAYEKAIYKKISECLEGDYLSFWNTIYSEFSGKDFPYDFYDSEHFAPGVLKHNTLYLSDSNYNELKNNIDKLELNFTNCNLKNLINQLKSKYDVMYLSNIPRWMFDLDESADTLFKIIKSDNIRFVNMLRKLSKNLNKNGVILANYCYSCSEANDLERVLNNRKIKSINFKETGAIIYKK